MNDLDLSKDLPTRTFGFNVPCRQFIIEAQVTRDRRMPMVDEFALRVLKLCEKVSIARLIAFFGFSQLEMQVVLADLQARSLVVLDENSVRLHPSANEMFRTAGSGPPTILEVEGWVNRLWFDLISQTMIASPNLRNVRNLIELKAPRDKQNVPIEFARQAFQSNFREYLRNVRKINNPEHLSLYAITSIEAARFSYAQITGHQALRYDPGPKVENTLHVPEVERPQRLRRLTDAMTQALSDYSDPEPSMNARSEYSRLTASDSLLSASGVGEFVDVRKWLELEGARRSEDVQPFIGSSYLESNRKAFATMLERSADIEKLTDEAPVEILWFRPGGSLWGTSEDLRAAIAELRSSIRRYSRCNPAIQFTLVVPATVQRDQRRRFGTMFDRGVDAPAGVISPSMEILLVRGLGALISVLVPLAAQVRTWVGRMTVINDDIDRIEKRIQWNDKARSLVVIWAQRSSSPELQTIASSKEVDPLRERPVKDA